MTAERAQITALLACSAVILLAPVEIAIAAMFLLAAVMQLVVGLWSPMVMSRPRVRRGRGVLSAVCVAICALLVRVSFIVQDL